MSLLRRSTRILRTASIRSQHQTSMTTALARARPGTATSFRIMLSSTTPSSNDSNNKEEDNPGFFEKIRQSFEDRSKQKQADKYAAQLKKMASKETWTLKDFQEDLDEALSGWAQKIPGVSSLQQNKMAKQAQTIVKAIAEELGGDCTMQDLQSRLGRREKARIVVKSGATMEDLNVMMAQAQAIDMMHQVLRWRISQGKSIPTDEASMKAAVQVDAPKALSKQRKKQMQEVHRKKAMRNMGIKRR